MKRLFLDDYRQPIDCCQFMQRRNVDVKIYHENWHVVKNYPEFVCYILANGLPDIISFDHDLADGHYHKNMQEGELNYLSDSFENEYNKTGYHCAQWLINYCMDNNKKLPEYIVHSWNPVGTKNIQNVLDNYKLYE